MKKIIFLTGTRADYGKLKPLMQKMAEDGDFETHLFVTGMHLLTKYGYTCSEIEQNGFRNIYKFINQNDSDGMDHILAKTITGLSDYVREIKPDLLIVHGDRVEALAGAIVGSLNNIPTGHIEGGEVSGTIDELIRHAVTKLSHLHFVANKDARRRLVQLGEDTTSIHIIGSPDIDVMNSAALPTIDAVKNYYEINYDKYSILILHSVTTELDLLEFQVNEIIVALIESKLNYVVIYPNNDPGSEIILKEFNKKLLISNNFRIFPSMRFEYFLTLLKYSNFIIGNSSAGIREAPFFGVPTVNIGTRQNRRSNAPSIINAISTAKDIGIAISQIKTTKRIKFSDFGLGDSANEFIRIIKSLNLKEIETQKYFNDIGNSAINTANDN